MHEFETLMATIVKTEYAMSGSSGARISGDLCNNNERSLIPNVKMLLLSMDRTS